MELQGLNDAEGRHEEAASSMDCSCLLRIKKIRAVLKQVNVIS